MKRSVLRWFSSSQFHGEKLTDSGKKGRNSLIKAYSQKPEVRGWFFTETTPQRRDVNRRREQAAFKNEPLLSNSRRPRSFHSVVNMQYVIHALFEYLRYFLFTRRQVKSWALVSSFQLSVLWNSVCQLTMLGLSLQWRPQVTSVSLWSWQRQGSCRAKK